MQDAILSGDARALGALGISPASLGLTVPRTGRLESLPYEPSARTSRSWGPSDERIVPASRSNPPPTKTVTDADGGMQM